MIGVSLLTWVAFACLGSFATGAIVGIVIASYWTEPIDAGHVVLTPRDVHEPLPGVAVLPTSPPPYDWAADLGALAP